MRSRCLSRVTSMMAVVAVVTGSAETVLAQEAPAKQKIGGATIAELQRIVDAAAARSGAVGVQVSVILGNQRADFVAGTANAELGLPMTVQTVIQVGSTTKVLNAQRHSDYSEISGTAHGRPRVCRLRQNRRRAGRHTGGRRSSHAGTGHVTSV